MKKILLLCAVTALLSACGGGGSGGNGESVTPPGGTSFLDGFITFVTNLVSSAPEDTPAREIDSVGVTSPETTPPAVVN